MTNDVVERGSTRSGGGTRPAVVAVYGGYGLAKDSAQIVVQHAKGRRKW